MKTEAERIKKGIYEETRRHIEEGARPLADVLAERDRRLTEAKEPVGHAQERLDGLVAPLKKTGEELANAERALDTFARAVDAEARAAGTRGIRARQEGNVGAAEYLGRKSAGIMYRIPGVTSQIADEIAGGVAKSVRGKVGTGNIRSALARIRREFSDDFSDVAGEE